MFSSSGSPCLPLEDNSPCAGNADGEEEAAFDY